MNPKVMTVSATLLGLTLLILSAILSTVSSRGWWSGMLSDIGIAVLLVIPIYWITKALDRRIDKVGERAERSVGALSSRIDSMEESVENRLDDFASEISDRLKSEREQDLATFEKLSQVASRSNLVDALRRARSQGLIERSPRVLVSTADQLFVAFQLLDESSEVDPTASALELVVEDLAGNRRDIVSWLPEESETGPMIKLGRAIDAITGPPSSFDVKDLFTGLSKMLTIANSSSERRPIVQWCEPQWAVCTWGLSSFPKPVTINAGRFDDLDWSTHVAGKGWADMDSFEDAYSSALALRNNGRLASDDR